MSFVSADGGGNVVVSGEGDGGGSVNEQLAALEAEEAQAKYKAAYQEGWNACEQQLSGQLETLNGQINALSSEIPKAVSAYFQELESQVKVEIGDLAFRIAHMILKDEIAHEDRMRSLINEALSSVSELKDVKLRLNPEMAEAIAENSGGGLPIGVEPVPDPGLACGEAVIESSQGFIDATLQGRLESLKEKFREMLEEENIKNKSFVQNA
jgi:flagellar biosynthesis/type III secretory pathway protein FliH